MAISEQELGDTVVMGDVIAGADQARLKGWMHVANGRKFWPLDPKPEDIYPEDIAHALSMLCRYGGHVREFYSVAQHTIYVAFRVDPRFIKWALLHDASEAYLVDMPRPIKHQPEFAFYNVAEERIQKAVAERFNLPWPIPEEVKKVDSDICYDEMYDLFGEEKKVRKVVTSSWTPDVAKNALLENFRYFGIE